MRYFAPKVDMKHDVWLREAQGVARDMARCLRRQVGCILVTPLGHHVGWNAMEPAAEPGCLEGACPRGQQPYERVPAFSDYSPAAGVGLCHATHAEAMALRHLRAAGLDPRDATAYITCAPCPGCAALLAEAGVTEIYTPEGKWAA